MGIGTAAAIALGVGALGSAAIGASAASKAGKYQERAADKGVEEQRAAREEMRRLLEPYVAAGGPALEAQMGALGLAGPEAQQAYVSQQEQSPIYQALARQQWERRAASMGLQTSAANETTNANAEAEAEPEIEAKAP